MGDHNHRSTDSQLLKLYAASASVRSPHRFVDSQDCQRQDYRKIGTNGSVSSPDGVNGGIINMNMNMNRVLTTSVGTVSRNGSNGSNSLSLSSVASQESDFLLAPHTNIDSTGRSDTVLLHPRHPLSTQVSPTALSGTNTLDKTKTEHNWGPHNDYIRAIPESATAMEYAPHLPLMK